MNLKPWSFRRSSRRPIRGRRTLVLLTGFTPLVGLITLSGTGPASASYVPALSVSISIKLVDPGDCLKHTFFVHVGSDAGHPTGTAELIANGNVLQSRSVPAGGSLTMAVSSSALHVGSNTVTASFVPTGNWSPATASIVINNLAPASCQPLINTGGTGPLIDTGMAPDAEPSGFPWWIIEAVSCGLIAAGGFVARRTPTR